MIMMRPSFVLIWNYESLELTRLMVQGKQQKGFQNYFLKVFAKININNLFKTKKYIFYTNNAI
jgi:hypothetical protein